jgi:SpoVK/Ycf46/Vps4 family AAA+-type ATPase
MNKFVGERERKIREPFDKAMEEQKENDMSS